MVPGSTIDASRSAALAEGQRLGRRAASVLHTETRVQDAMKTSSSSPADPFAIARIVLPSLAVLGAALAWATPGHAADLPGSFRGGAFATFANVAAGPVAAQLGRSANQPCPCRGTNGNTLSNEIDALKAGDGGSVLTADVTLSTVHTEKTDSTALVRDVSTITNARLLGGLITADTIKSVAEVDATTTTMVGTSAGSNLANLKVAGVLIDPAVAPNTVLDLPGIGTVTLNRVVRTGSFKKTGQILVEALTIDVSQSNTLGLKVGAHIVVGHAVAGYNRVPVSIDFAGQAYAATANDKIGNDLQNKIGKVALVTLGCQGTNGKVTTNNVTADAVGTLLSIGTGSTTAVTMTSPSGGQAKTTATVQSLSLLGGLIKAAAVNAVALQKVDAGVVSSSTDGSGFVGLTVAGIPVPVSVPPNTGVTLPMLGQVVVNEQILPATPGARVIVNGLHVKVGLLNLLGLPVGTEIVIAHADAAATPF